MAITIKREKFKDYVIEEIELDGWTVAYKFTYPLTVTKFDFIDSDDLIEYDPNYDDYRYPAEHELVEIDEQNKRIGDFRIKLFCAGFWWAIELPYKAEFSDEGDYQGMIVIEKLALDENITFESPWNPPVNRRNFSPTHRGTFMPAVPLSSQPSWAKEGDYKVAEDGFTAEEFYLVWHYDL